MCGKGSKQNSVASCNTYRCNLDRQRPHIDIDPTFLKTKICSSFSYRAYNFAEDNNFNPEISFEEYWTTSRKVLTLWFFQFYHCGILSAGKHQEVAYTYLHVAWMADDIDADE